MQKEILRELALIDELRTASGLIKYGLRELQSIGGANDFYHIPILTLANGFERLMKVIICLHLTEIHGVYPGTCPGEYPWPDKKKKINKGHDLDFLLEYIIEHCFKKEYIELDYAVGSKDILFLQSEELRSFIKLLSGFGMSSRYYNLDFYKDGKSDKIEPKRQWNLLEKMMVEQYRGTINSNDPVKYFDILRQIINNEVVILFEKLARALSRLFTIGKLSQRALELSPEVFVFIRLYDEKLGKVTW